MVFMDLRVFVIFGASNGENWDLIFYYQVLLIKYIITIYY